MTNYEKNKEKLDMYSVAGVAWGVDKNGKVIECISTSCMHCIFGPDDNCAHYRLNWLQQEYKESEVDWTKVEVDTLVLVRDDKSEKWKARHFAGYYNGNVFTYNHDATSDNYTHMISWKYAKLAEQED